MPQPTVTAYGVVKLNFNLEDPVVNGVSSLVSRDTALNGFEAIAPDASRWPITNINTVPATDARVLTGEWALAIPAAQSPPNGTWQLVAKTTISDSVGNPLPSEQVIDTIEVNI